MPCVTFSAANPKKSTLDLRGKVRINELERKHREGYKRKPVKRGEFNNWVAER
jgi:hypothetical protein